MGRHVVVSSASLGMDCWSPSRFMRRCHECDRVERCKLPEATLGRLMLAERALANLEELTKKKRKEIAEAKAALRKSKPQP